MAEEHNNFDVAGDLGLLGERLDITSDNLSFAKLDVELENFADGALLNVVLDGEADPSDVLRQYESRLATAEVDAISGYIAESDNLMALHGDIVACNEVLADIENILAGYASNLEITSTEIRSLQERSQQMNEQIKSRRALQDGLSDFLARIVLLPSLIHTIVELSPPSEEFSAGLRTLSEKLHYVANHPELSTDSTAFKDVEPELNRLRTLAVAKCKKLLMGQINEMRKPQTRVQAIQSAMLRNKDMIRFLKDHSAVSYDEVKAAYIEKLGGKLLDVFRSYWAAMERAEVTVVGPNDLLGTPEASSTAMGVAGVLSMLSLGGSTQQSASYGFALGNRSQILASIDHPPIVFQSPDTESRKFTFEVLFRSISKLLMDTGAYEYLFCREFWGDEASKVYHASFGPIVSFVQASLEASVAETYDPVGLLLAIRINRELALFLARRAIPALDDHFDAVNLLFWPRLKSILDAQLDSLSSLSVDALLNSGDISPSKVLPLTSRYADLMASVLALHSDFLDGPLGTNIERMRYSVMNLLLTLSRGLARGKGAVFLIHNFSHVVSTLKDTAAANPSGVLNRTGADRAGTRDASATAKTSTMSKAGADSGKPMLVESQHEVEKSAIHKVLGAAGESLLMAFEEALSKATALYVDARLMAGCPQLMSFVRRGDLVASKIEKGEIVQGYGPEEAMPIAKDFTSRWERVVSVLEREISQDFGHSLAGRNVRQAAFSQLLLTWSRFLELLTRQGETGAEIARGSVSMAAVMYAVKQYR